MVEDKPGNFAGGGQDYPVNQEEPVGIDNHGNDQGQGQQLEGAQPGRIADQSLAPTAAQAGISQFPIIRVNVGEQADRQGYQAGRGQPPAPGPEQEPGAVAQGGYNAAAPQNYRNPSVAQGGIGAEVGVLVDREQDQHRHQGG